MSDISVLTVVGARPQFIKASAVSRALAAHGGVRETLVHTGQHFDDDMARVFFEELSIPRPDHNLDIHGGGHGDMTGRMLMALEPVVREVAPDWVLIYGDTNSTLAGALVASKLNVPVAHVEAGLRSHNMRMPEEVNRIVADRLSSLLLCPTTLAVDNLRAEGIGYESGVRVELVGDVMFDAALHFGKLAEKQSGLAQNPPIQGEFILCTAHRAENTDDADRLRSMLKGLDRVSRMMPVVLPLHPRTRGKLAEFGLKLPEGVTALDPLGYLDMLALLKTCSLVMTDSGGLQKESYFFSKPCVTLRDETEWVELVDMGVNVLAGADEDVIVDSVDRMLGHEVRRVKGLYGEGQASEQVVRELLKK